MKEDFYCIAYCIAPRDNYDRLIVLGDFNMDQKSPEHQGCFTDLCLAFSSGKRLYIDTKTIERTIEFHKLWIQIAQPN